MIKQSFYPLLVVLLMSSHVNAQRELPQKEIVYSEMKFAKQAHQGGIKYAFEQNLDPAGMIVSGIRIVNGLKAYANVKTDTTDLLAWQPSHARINAAGDFGFTTGPYLYFAHRAGKPVASGHYFSIWKKDDEHIFKVVFDGGVNHTEMKIVQEPMHTNTSTVRAVLLKTSSSTRIPAPPMISNTTDVLQYLDKEVMILRANQPIALGSKNYQPLPEKLVCVPKKHGYDRSGQLFYHFGNLSGSEADGAEGKFKGYYVQVWRFAKKWTIVADVIQLAN